MCRPKLARPTKIRIIPVTAPTKKLKKSQSIMALKDKRITPIAIASLTSPRPIPLPFVTRLRRRRKEEAKKPEKSALYKYDGLKKVQKYQRP